MTRLSSHRPCRLPLYPRLWVTLGIRCRVCSAGVPSQFVTSFVTTQGSREPPHKRFVLMLSFSPKRNANLEYNASMWSSYIRLTSKNISQSMNRPALLRNVGTLCSLCKFIRAVKLVELGRRMGTRKRAILYTDTLCPICGLMEQVSR